MTSLSETQLHIPCVERWLDGVLLDHLKEHCIEATRFLVVDTLQREWGDYVEDYRSLESERQQAFLKKQGYARFADVLAHIIAWWEKGITKRELSWAKRYLTRSHAFALDTATKRVGLG